MTGILSNLETSIRELLDFLFREEQLTSTVTYCLYRGQTAGGEDLFDEFPVPAIPASKISSTVPIPSRLQAQSGSRTYVIREEDLPDQVSVNDLSTSDRLVHGDSQLHIVEVVKTLGFLISVIARGE
jgi:hypothetical protein